MGTRTPDLSDLPGQQSVVEEIANAITSGIGTALSVTGLVLMVVYAALHGDVWHVVSVSIFGATLILSHLSSTLYHAIAPPGPKRVLKVFDHLAIYFLIAGTYTPFTLVNLRGPWGWGLFVAIWALAIGGVLIDSGNFDWEGSGKFPGMTEPYAGYHGLDFAEEFGPAAFIMRARAEGLRDFGACMAPQTAFYLLQGLETLPMRMARHVRNAQAVADFLVMADEVAWVTYPGQKSHPDHALAQRLLPDGAGAIVTFGIKPGTEGPRRAGAKFIEALELFSHLANVGDAKSLVIHPASTTHQQMTAADLETAGVGEEMVRLAIGLEDTGDIVADLKQALRASQE